MREAIEAASAAARGYREHIDACHLCDDGDLCETGRRLRVRLTEQFTKLERRHVERPVDSCPGCSSPLCPHRLCRVCSRCPAREAQSHIQKRKGARAS